MTENTYIVFCVYNGASQVKDLPANAGDSRDVCSIPGLGRFPGEGNDNPLQYFLLGKSHGQGNLAGYSPQDHRVRYN